MIHIKYQSTRPFGFEKDFKGFFLLVAMVTTILHETKFFEEFWLILMQGISLRNFNRSGKNHVKDDLRSWTDKINHIL